MYPGCTASACRPGDPVGRCPANTQLFRGLSRRQSRFDEGLRGREGLPVEWRATGPSAAFSGCRNTVLRALGDQPPFEVSNRREDVEHQFAGSRGRVDAFLEADQVDVVRLEVLDRFQQFLEGAPEAVEAGDAEAVAGAGMVDNCVSPGRSNCRPEITSTKTRMAPAWRSRSSWAATSWSAVATRA